MRLTTPTSCGRLEFIEFYIFDEYRAARLSSAGRRGACHSQPEAHLKFIGPGQDPGELEVICAARVRPDRHSGP
jgi:hypothetical protein